METIDQSYEYKPKWVSILLGFCIFSVLAFGLGYMAQWNDKGLILNGIISLSRENATRFYWALSLCCAVFMLVPLIQIYQRLVVRNHRIALTPSSLIVPGSSFSSEEKTIPYSNITELSTSQVHGHKFLHVKHTGRKITIVSSMLSSKDNLEEIYNLLSTRIKKAS